MKSRIFEIRSLTARRGRNKAVFSLALLLVLVYPFLLNPFQENIVPCFFKETIGADCPTCGLSRSIYEFSRFHLAEAFSFHLLGPFFYVGSLVFFLKLAIEWLTKKEIKLNISSGALKLGMFFAAGLWIIFWLNKLVR